MNAWPDHRFVVESSDDASDRVTLLRGGKTAGRFAFDRLQQDDGWNVGRVDLSNDRGRLEISSGVRFADEKVRVSVHGGMSQVLDVGHDLEFDFARYEEAHLIHVSGTYNGARISLALDPRGGLGRVVLPAPVRISRPVVALARSFEPYVIERLGPYLTQRRQYESVIDETIVRSRWQAIGRAGCWGITGLASAWVCLGLQGTACLIAALTANAAASLCSDAISPRSRTSP
jgi:hypothetical protein